MSRVANTKIETRDGRFFDYADPAAEDVHLQDVARALALTTRFNGHVGRMAPVFYSVAEHALLVRDLVIEAGHPELGYAALHHDDEEAYLGDIPKPLKPFLGQPYSALAKCVEAVVGEAFGIDPALFHHPVIKAADRLALRVEAHHLKASQGLAQEYGQDVPPELPEHVPSLRHLDPVTAETAFIFAHHEELGR